METERSYYAMMLNSLCGIEDDLVANRAPLEAVRHVQEAVKLCQLDYKKRFVENAAGADDSNNSR